MSITEKAVDILTQSICKKNFKSLKEQAAQHTVIHWHKEMKIPVTSYIEKSPWHRKLHEH